MLTHFHLLSGCFQATGVELTVTAETTWPTWPDIFTIWPFIENFANFCVGS